MVTCVPTGPLVGVKLKSCGSTRKGTLLVRVPVGVVTVTGPVVPPAGIVAVISVSDLTVKEIEVPLSETFVVPVKPWPRIGPVWATYPELRTNPKNGLRFVERLKMVPQEQMSPPFSVVP